MTKARLRPPPERGALLRLLLLFFLDAVLQVVEVALDDALGRLGDAVLLDFVSGFLLGRLDHVARLDLGLAALADRFDERAGEDLAVLDGLRRRLLALDGERRLARLGPRPAGGDAGPARAAALV